MGVGVGMCVCVIVQLGTVLIRRMGECVYGCDHGGCWYLATVVEHRTVVGDDGEILLGEVNRRLELLLKGAWVQVLYYVWTTLFVGRVLGGSMR